MSHRTPDPGPFGSIDLLMTDVSGYPLTSLAITAEKAYFSVGSKIGDAFSIGKRLK